MLSEIKRLLNIGGPEIPVVRLTGVISAKESSVNLDRFAPVLDRAFALAKKGEKFVILAIESPGGSPVQSDLIGQYVRNKAAETGAKVAAVIGDVGASGGYWIACAGDAIYANPMSVVGSIGVIGGGFGVHELIRRYGVERRIETAGVNKLRNDPFAPERPEDVVFTRELLADIHEQFKSWVRGRRGSTIEGHEEEIFDGSYMLGSRAKALGLIDDFADVRSLIRKKFGGKAKPHFLAPKKRMNLLRLFTRGVVAEAVDTVEAEILRPRVR